MSLHRLNENTFLFPSIKSKVPHPNIGIIIGDNETILIDSGNSQEHVNQIKAELSKIQAPPVKYILLTHYHWDHCFGSCYFEGASVMGSRLTGQLLETEAGKPWSKEFLQKDIRDNPLYQLSHSSKLKSIKNWRDFRIIIPDFTFDSTCLLPVKSPQWEALLVGGKHSLDSSVYFNKKEKIIFLGDCFYPPPVYLNASDKSFNTDMMESFLELDMTFYVHGHGQVATRKSFESLIEKFK